MIVWNTSFCYTLYIYILYILFSTNHIFFYTTLNLFYTLLELFRTNCNLFLQEQQFFSTLSKTFFHKLQLFSAISQLFSTEGMSESLVWINEKSVIPCVIPCIRRRGWPNANRTGKVKDSLQSQLHLANSNQDIRLTLTVYLCC